ncbi:hypothetical protein H257_01784 [Aphanomyces astaci]|uniref:Uncharacterized protein n=1 Tax=Aphanomyces astaci TaxID=112090 RepID=W4H5X3_APHAT|nr:hypothetical protein H257_01784 [Aphanomyces astaci]ETV86659.1 hypothetical protein H257_01784 [Aphanomyces astaci]|eukprot:XP_009823458.1 hypothetical protein H257_01784 [Aphanomyces astaci]
MESSAEHAERLRKLKSKRDIEPSEEHTLRLQNIKEKRDMQPPVAYELRLQQMAARRDMKTSEERATSLLNLKARRIMQSPEAHASRLRKQKAYWDMETPEVHATRLLNLKAKRYMESLEQHRARLDNQRAQRSLESREGRVMRLRGIQVKSLFDVQYLKHMPDKATMQQLAMNDNMASPTLFDRSIEAFTKVVVGFVKTIGRPRKTGGIFGYGKDLLHTPCKACEHVDTKYEALDPPLTAFEKPRRSEGVLPKEPIMAKCGHCNTMVSSQHLSNTASNTYVAPDKDTFCLDHIYRELSSTPFGPNETRRDGRIALRASNKAATQELHKCADICSLGPELMLDALAPAEDGVALSDEVKCRRRLASHMFNMTRKQEVAGPLCALYLLRESCAYTSHFYKKMPIRHVLKFLHHHIDTPFEVTINIKDSTLTPLTLKVTRMKMLHHLLDQGALGNQAYSYRLDISWFEFTSKFFRANSADGTSSDKLFVERHSLHKSKCIGVHRLARIPVLTGGVRVPFFGDCLKPVERDIHAQVALVMFKPFRVLSDLCPHGSTWHAAWEAFQPTMSTECCKDKNVQGGRTEHPNGKRLMGALSLGTSTTLTSKAHSWLPVDIQEPATWTVMMHSELYQAVSSSEMSNKVKFPTMTPIEADIVALVGGKSLDEASTTTSSSYMSILGTWDQRHRCREQFASDVKGLKTWMSKKRVKRVVTSKTNSVLKKAAMHRWLGVQPSGEIPTLVQVNVPGALDPSTILWIGMHNLTPSTVHDAKEADEKGVPGYTEDLKLLLVDEMSMMSKQQLFDSTRHFVHGRS